MVRVAALKHAVEEGDTAPDPAGLRPRQQLIAISERAHEMVERSTQTAHGGDPARPGRARASASCSERADLEQPQRTFLARYFTREFLPALTPLAIDVSRPFPQLAEPEPEPRPPPRARRRTRSSRALAVVQVPARPARGSCASRRRRRQHLRAARGDHPRRAGRALPRPEVLESAAFRIARDAEMELDDEGGRDYLEAIEDELRKRRRSRVVRLEVEAGVGDTLLEHPGPAPGDRRARTSTASAAPSTCARSCPLVDLPALEHLRDPPLQAAARAGAARERRHLLPSLDERDVLLHHPYESFDPVVAFVTAGRRRPRRARHQADALPHERRLPVVQALARAAENGKQVTVLVELMARFDEQSNIRWARSLEEAGAHVIYGIRGYKTHAKICLVVRRGCRGIERYVHLATGNYNDRTARIYTDFGLMTVGPRHRARTPRPSSTPSPATPTRRA